MFNVLVCLFWIGWIMCLGCGIAVLGGFGCLLSVVICCWFGCLLLLYLYFTLFKDLLLLWFADYFVGCEVCCFWILRVVSGGFWF